MDKSEQSKADQGTPAIVNTPEKHRTVGNIIYDFGVFGSIAWGGVAILSALSAHEAMHGKNPAFGWLRAINDKGSAIFKTFFSEVLPKTTKRETIDGLAKGTTMFLTLGMGGNALAAPIKWMEDNRQRNAAYIDKFLGTTPPDPETIAHEPKQTWKSVFSGRLFSWGMSYAAFLAMGPKLTSHINDWFGKKATEQVMHLSPQSNVKNVRKWADIVAFDALFTVITATITYAMSRFIAARDERKHPERIHADEPAHDYHAVQPVLLENHAAKVKSNKDANHPEKTEFAKRYKESAEASHGLAL